AKAKFAAFDVAFDLLTVFWSRALGDDNQRAETAGGFALFYRLSNFVVIKRNLGNQNNIGAAGDSTMKCDPAGVTSHHFDNHHSLMTRRRGVQAVERVHHFSDR